ncbi:hypothetical protein C9426_24770 [Serratia sp. S1B]|nr:hypothetical protein C9426_24770 [Serratia sp. S1B]
MLMFLPTTELFDQSIHEIFKSWVILTVMGYGYSLFGIISLVSSIILEFLINPYIKNNILFILICALLGYISGLTIFPVQSILTGVIVGGYMRWLFIRDRRSMGNPQQS